MSKKVAVVGWGGDSGVGRELIDATRNLIIDSAFIIPNESKPTRTDLLKLPCVFAKSFTPGIPEMEAFLDAHKPDTILTWEVPGSWDYPELWHRRGIRWVHMVHWDWFAPKYRNLWKLAHLVCPNKMAMNILKRNYGLYATLLPVPVDTAKLKFEKRSRALRFVSIYGFGGAHDRRSLGEVLEAWRMLANPPILRVMAQKQPPELAGKEKVRNVDVLLGNTPEPGDLYNEADIAVQPSRYEGVGVSMLEAQARGVPVIAVDAAPMNEIVRDLLVPVSRTVEVNLMEKKVVSNIPCAKQLSQLIDGIQRNDISDLSIRARAMVETEYSWKALRERWTALLRG